MKNKNKNTKVPKSATSRFSDLTPKKDAQGGRTSPVNVGRWWNRRTSLPSSVA
jgi:hypothetical protein